MADRTVYVALLVSILPLTGCGTVANLVTLPPAEGGKTPFGGLRQDVSCMKKAEYGELSLGTHPKAESPQHARVGLLLLCAADVPFSLLGDVVTWPYTAAYSLINQPIPVPPVIQAPNSPPRQAAAAVPPQTPPLEQLPTPRQLP